LDETPDEGLVGGHAWKIFPILHRRYLFAGVEQFFLYDLYRSDGGVDEDVFAYSNVHNDERGLVIYHNRFADTRGWIKTSAAYLDKSTGDLRQKSLAEALSLPFEGYVIFKDYVTHLEYIRACEEFWQKGLYLELHAYQHHVFMDWQFVDDEQWRDIHVALNGAGVESMQTKWEEMFGISAEIEELTLPEEEPKAKKPRKKAEGGTLRSKGGKKPVVKKEEKSKKKEVKTSSKVEKSTPKKKVTAKSQPVSKVVKKAVPIKKPANKKVTRKSK
jgi:hypothetical protein